MGGSSSTGRRPLATSDELKALFAKLIFFGLALWLGGMAIYWCASEMEIYRTFHVYPPKEFNHCILRNMPGTSNEVVYQAVIAKCDRYDTNARVLGLFYNMRSAEDCVIRFANRTENLDAQKAIQSSCYALMQSVAK